MAAVVASLRDRPRDEQADEHREVREELGRLERRFRLGRQAAQDVVASSVVTGGSVVANGGVATHGHSST